MDKMSSRIKVLALLVALMFIALSTRLWFLQVLATTQFQQEARDNSVRFVYTEPLRGLMYDDRGRPLVENQESLEVRVNRDAMGTQAERDAYRLGHLLNAPFPEPVARPQAKRAYSSRPLPAAGSTPPNG